MKALHRVVWSKGMFLTPQHFQTQDDWLETTQHFRFSASNFANWGVTSIAINEEALANGVFTLRYCEGVLPDGLVFSMPEADELPASRNVNEFFPPTQRSLDVFLAIPESRPRAKNFSFQLPGQPAPMSTRYVAEIRKVADATSGNEDKEVQVARRSFRLLLEGENLDGFTVLRVAQVARNPAGACVPNSKFVAPCLDVASSEYLMMLLRRQIEVLSAKSSSLALPRRQKGRSLADFTTSEVANFWLLHTVNSYLPELKHIWKVRHGHPEALWVAMLRLAGALSTFSLEANALELPDYDHDNLGACFSELDGRVRALLETVIPSKCIAIPLESVDAHIWSGSIPDDQFLKNSQCFLSVSSRIGVDELIGKFPRLAIASSPAEIHRLVRHALPGIGLRHAASPPAAIPLKLENQYFSLNQADPLWQPVAQSRTLNVFVPGEIAEPKMELLIVLQ